MTRTGRVALGLLMSIAGAGLLVWQVHHVGLDSIRRGFSLVGVWFLAILLLSGLRYVVRAIAWVTLIGGGVPLRTAIVATIAGDAVGTLTPLRLIASEPTKAVLLREHMDTPRALAALVAENVFYSASVAVVILAGTAAMLSAFKLDRDLTRAAWLIGVAMAATLAIALWILWKRPAVVSALLARVPFPRVQRIVIRVREFEAATYGFVNGHPARLAAVVAAELAFHALSFAESYLTLSLLTGVSTPLEAFVLDTVNRIINVAFIAVPLKVGVAETGQGLVAAAIGLNAATGVTFALVGKARILAWAGGGIGLLWTRIRGEAKETGK